MTDETWRGIIIRSIPPTPKWLPVIPSLYTLSSSADIISTLLAHGMVLGRYTSNKGGSPSNTVLAARTSEGCTNPNCKAKKRSTHTTANCYWPGGGKEGQFPPNFGQRSKANAATSAPTASTTTSTPAQTDHFVLSARTMDTPGQSGVLVDGLIDSPELIDGLIDAPALIDEVIDDLPMALISQGFQTLGKGEVSTFMDSGASDTMFISKNAFSEYKSITPRKGDSAKAENGSF